MPPEIIDLTDDEDGVRVGTASDWQAAAAAAEPPNKRARVGPSPFASKMRSSSITSLNRANGVKTTAKVLVPRHGHAPGAYGRRRPSSPPRPYLPYSRRQQIIDCIHTFATANPTIVHIDFSTAEIRALHKLARRYHKAFWDSKNTPIVGLDKLLRHRKRKVDQQTREALIAYVLKSIKLDTTIVRHRTVEAVKFFLRDIIAKRVSLSTSPATVLVADNKHSSDTPTTVKRSQRTSSLLFARELYGPRGFTCRGTFLNIKNELRKAREDGLELRAQWTNCAGDIHTACWVSNHGFIVGTTNHSDRHNQQYNRPGNLLLGSIADKNTLRSYPDHRILRPIIGKGDNSTNEMRQSQDPFLYTTICDSVYDSRHNRAYTCGYDRTVKIWRVGSNTGGLNGLNGLKSGIDTSRMDMLGSWTHEGNVNFVVASQRGLIATAADVAKDAVRVYKVNVNDVSASPFTPFSCKREVREDQKWAYCPATIKWGVAPGVSHLLLVGYSPRSLTENINDVPVDVLQTGESALFDTTTGERLKINTASNANVFDVAWHPFLHTFLVATSPCGQFDDGVKTQIYIYMPADITIDPTVAVGSYSVVKTLDCSAADINEIAVRPNSIAYAYITAGCTDGNVYIWDTASCDEDSDKPIYILPHGRPVETLIDGAAREDEDVGVKFMAWGKTPDRLYTGSSDGVVKVWSIRSDRDPHLWDILEAPGAITYGAFSPDYSRLIVGDATGRVSLLSIHDNDEKPDSFILIGGRKLRRPQLAIPHEEPPPPIIDADNKAVHHAGGREMARVWLDSNAIRLCRVGAVQGPRYGDVTGLFENKSHLDGHYWKPLLGRVQCLQQEERGEVLYPNLKKLGLECQSRVLWRRSGWDLEDKDCSVVGLGQGLNALSLDPDTRKELEAEGAILELDDYYFVYEEGPRDGYWSEGVEDSEVEDITANI